MLGGADSLCLDPSLHSMNCQGIYLTTPKLIQGNLMGSCGQPHLLNSHPEAGPETKVGERGKRSPGWLSREFSPIDASASGLASQLVLPGPSPTLG